MTSMEPARSLAPEEIAWKLAQRVAATEFVPKDLRGRPDAVLACILTGRELGAGGMTALQHIAIIDGKPTLSATLMRSLVARRGHTIRPEEMTDERCVMYGRRADDGGELRVTWTTEDARRAKIGGKNNWQTYPRAMLLARATTELCRALFADVLGPVAYEPEEVGGPVAAADLDLPPCDDDTEVPVDRDE